MDWTIPLKFQQADFLKRCAPAVEEADGTAEDATLRCDRPGCYSEAMAVSGEQLAETRALCRQLVLMSDPSLPVRELLEEYFYDQLARLPLARTLNELAVAGDPQNKTDGSPPVDFIIRGERQLGVRAKGAKGKLEEARWRLSAADICHNAAIAFVVVPDSTLDTISDCRVLQAGFLPTANMELRQGEIWVEARDLLYGGGLRAYLEFLQAEEGDRAPAHQWLRPLTGSSNSVYPIAIAADGQTLATSSYDGTIKLWHFSEPRLQQLLGGQSWSFSPKAVGNENFNPNRDRSGFDLRIRDSGEPMGSLAGHASGVSALLVTRDRQYLVGGGYDGTIKIWQLGDRKLLRTLDAHSGGVSPLALDPGDRLLASSGTDNQLKLWDLHTGELLRAFPPRDEPICAIAIGPEGRFLASGTQTGTIEIWNGQTGERQLSMPGHAGAIAAMTASEDGTLLASSSAERTIKLWNLATGTLEKILTGYPDPLMKVAPNADGGSIDLNVFEHPEPGWEE